MYQGRGRERTSGRPSLQMTAGMEADSAPAPAGVEGPLEAAGEPALREPQLQVP